ncbi:MAG TPA: hypothetical protein VNO52_04400 [Methylomirabilota bacterium]|nr:hypothetical protein [Methylomirabilota bacterium]
MKTNPHCITLTSKVILVASLAAAAAGCTTAQPPGEIVAWAEFTLAANVSEATMLKAADLVHENFLRQQPGFVRWELLRGKDGQWVNLIHWMDQASADRALERVDKSPACSNYFKCMAGLDEAVPFYRRVKTYPR